MKYKFLKDYEEFKADAVVDTDLIGDVDQAKVDELIADGTLEVFVEEVAPKVGDVCTFDDGRTGTLQTGEGDALVCVADEVQAKVDDTANTTATAEKAPEYHFNGKLVISCTTRTVNEKEVKHVRLEDGTESDLSSEEYEAMIEASVK